MSIDADEIRRIAHLARLGIDEADTSRYAEELSRILDFVQQLEGADTQDVAPMSHPLDASQRLRPDEVTETDCRDDYLEQAPASSGGLFLVPRVTGLGTPDKE
jgi:aspartyl-tRNA(Asn)/glutamyl-tRNA(Gln) amidotransferase subunit C